VQFSAALAKNIYIYRRDAEAAENLFLIGLFLILALTLERECSVK
jgi:hypothetical protein